MKGTNLTQLGRYVIMEKQKPIGRQIKKMAKLCQAYPYVL